MGPCPTALGVEFSSFSPRFFPRYIRRRCTRLFRLSRGRGLVLQLLELRDDRLLECICCAVIQSVLCHESLFPTQMLVLIAV